MRFPFPLLAVGLISGTSAQTGFVPNYDESAVPAYQLPDPLVFADGTRVTKPADWPKRRAEILALLETRVYGRTPAGIPATVTHEKRKPIDLLNGKAVLEEIRIVLSGKQNTRHIDLLLIKPKAPEGAKFRTFLTPNFLRLATIHRQPARSSLKASLDSPGMVAICEWAGRTPRGNHLSRSQVILPSWTSLRRFPMALSGLPQKANS